MKGQTMGTTYVLCREVHYENGNGPYDVHCVHKEMVERAKLPYLWGLDVLSMTSTTRGPVGGVAQFSRPVILQQRHDDIIIWDH
ncbi:hypothetical protein VNO77_43594 [Canavalia gladiata]|uniref:Uncharacterized protein n=1 Tax=Canavalia gladiata TaxID=3824 RepID=A0AAN9JUD4_CANGL